MNRSVLNTVLAVIVSTPVIYFFQSCASSNGQSTPGAAAVAAGPVTQKIAYFRDGFGSYSGTRDTTIYVATSDWTSYPIVGAADTAQSLASGINTTLGNALRSFALISFDVSGSVSDMLQAGEACTDHIEVVKAELDIFASSSANTYLSAIPLKEDAPAWTESGATYTSANGTDNWPTAGVYPNQPVLNSVHNGYHDAVEGVQNGGVARHFTFHLYVEPVKNWVCDSSKNRGVILRYSGGTGYSQFFSREFPERSFRPSLTLWLRRI